MEFLNKELLELDVIRRECCKNWGLNFTDDLLSAFLMKLGCPNISSKKRKIVWKILWECLHINYSGSDERKGGWCLRGQAEEISVNNLICFQNAIIANLGS